MGARGTGPVALELNGEPLRFEREPDPYRDGRPWCRAPRCGCDCDRGNELRIQLG